jgi:hypothetical protein
MSWPVFGFADLLRFQGTGYLGCLGAAGQLPSTRHRCPAGSHDTVTPAHPFAATHWRGIGEAVAMVRSAPR